MHIVIDLAIIYGCLIVLVALAYTGPAVIGRVRSWYERQQLLSEIEAEAAEWDRTLTDIRAIQTIEPLRRGQ